MRLNLRYLLTISVSCLAISSIAFMPTVVHAEEVNDNTTVVHSDEFMSDSVFMVQYYVNEQIRIEKEKEELRKKQELEEQKKREELAKQSIMRQQQQQTQQSQQSESSAPAPVQQTSGSPKNYSLGQFKSTGVVYWGGHKYTYYSQSVLPGGGLSIPGRHLNSDGYVSDKDGFIVLANDSPKGSVFDTPFGYPGKVYDRGTYGNHLDVYIK